MGIHRSAEFAVEGDVAVPIHILRTEGAHTSRCIINLFRGDRVTVERSPDESGKPALLLHPPLVRSIIEFSGENIGTAQPCVAFAHVERIAVEAQPQEREQSRELLAVAALEPELMHHAPGVAFQPQRHSRKQFRSGVFGLLLAVEIQAFRLQFDARCKRKAPKSGAHLIVVAPLADVV